MGIKDLVLNILRIGTSWSVVALILGLRVTDLFSLKTAQSISISLPAYTNWDAVSAIGTLVTAVTALVALILTRNAGIFDKTPSVLASGTFIISVRNEKIGDKTTNQMRDKNISGAKSIHTLQLINVGRGLAKNVIPSVSRDEKGYLLEDVCPHSFALPSGKGTKDLGEILRVHGQRFVQGDDHELYFDSDRKTGHFYIHFEDYEGKDYLTRVKIGEVENADGEIENLITLPGIEIWKVIDNIEIKDGLSQR